MFTVPIIQLDAEPEKVVILTSLEATRFKMQIPTFPACFSFSEWNCFSSRLK